MFSILAEFSYLQLTTLVGGRYRDVRLYRHGRNPSSEAAGRESGAELPYTKQQVPSLWSGAEAERSKSVHEGEPDS